MKKNLLLALSLSTLLASCGANAGDSSTKGSTEQSEQPSVKPSESETTSTTPSDAELPSVTPSDSSSTTPSDSSSQTPSKDTLADYKIPEGGYNNEEVTINFYHTMGDSLQKVLEPAIEEFNEIYPNIEVKHQQIGGYDDVRDQVKTELSIGEGPSLAYCYPDHVALYNKTKRVVKLENLIYDETYGLTQEQIDDFVPGYWEEGLQFGDGSMYTLPFSKSTEVLYYNKTFFDANNLEVPTHWFAEFDNDTTSMEYVCKKIKQLDSNSIPLGYDSEANWFITMCEQLGSPYTSATGDHFLFNNTVNKSFVSDFKTWYQEGLVTTQQIYGAYTSGLFTNVTAGETHSYMSIGSSAGATHQRPTKGEDGNYPFEVGIAPIPQMDEDNQKVISQGPSICIFNKGTNDLEVLASWLFTKFLTTSVAFQAEFSIKSGYVPVIESVVNNATFQAHLAKANGGDGVAALSTKVCMEQVDNYYTSPAFIGSSEARDQVGDLLVAALSTNDKTIDQLFEEAVAACIANS